MKVIEDTDTLTLQDVTLAQEGFLLRYDGQPDVVAGDVIVTDDGAFRITEVRVNGNETVLVAQAATLEDLFVSLAVSGRLDMDGAALADMLAPRDSAQRADRDQPAATTSWTPPPFEVGEGPLAGTSIRPALNRLSFEPLLEFGTSPVGVANASASLVIDATLDARLQAAASAPELVDTLGKGCLPIRIEIFGLVGKVLSKTSPEFCVEVRRFAGASGFEASLRAGGAWRLSSADAGFVGYDRTNGARLDFPDLTPALLTTTPLSIGVDVDGVPPANCAYGAVGLTGGVELVPSIRMFKIVSLIRVNQRRYFDADVRYVNRTEGPQGTASLSTRATLQTTVGSVDQLPTRVEAFLDREGLSEVEEIEDLVDSLLSSSVYQSALFRYNERLLLGSPPVPPCATLQEPTLTPSGVNTNVTIDPVSVQPGVTTTYRVNSSTATVDPSGALSLPGPGRYQIEVISTAADGQSVSQTLPLEISAAGNYSGRFGGADFGSFSLQVAADGTLSGQAFSERDNRFIGLSGAASLDGAVNFLAGGTTGGARFTGDIRPGDGVWVLGGGWANTQSGQSGSFSGTSAAP